MCVCNRQTDRERAGEANGKQRLTEENAEAGGEKEEGKEGEREQVEKRRSVCVGGGGGTILHHHHDGLSALGPGRCPFQQQAPGTKQQTMERPMARSGRA